MKKLTDFSAIFAYFRIFICNIISYARKYLDILTSDNLLAKIRIGRDSYYVNVSMMETLTDLDTDSLKVEH